MATDLGGEVDLLPRQGGLHGNRSWGRGGFVCTQGVSMAADLGISSTESNLIPV